MVDGNREFRCFCIGLHRTYIYVVQSQPVLTS